MAFTTIYTPSAVNPHVPRQTIAGIDVGPDLGPDAGDDSNNNNNNNNSGSVAGDQPVPVYRVVDATKALSTGAIVGIVLGVAVFLSILILLFFALNRRRLNGSCAAPGKLDNGDGSESHRTSTEPQHPAGRDEPPAYADVAKPMVLRLVVPPRPVSKAGSLMESGMV